MMRGSRSTLLILGSAAAFLFVVGAPALSGADAPTPREQATKARAEMLKAGAPVATRGTRPDFGTTDGSTVNVQAYEFQGMDSLNDAIHDDGAFFRFFATSGGSQFMVAPVHVPSGVIIDSFEIDDVVNADNDMQLSLWDGGSIFVGPPPTQIGPFFYASAGSGLEGVGGLNSPYTQNHHDPLLLMILWGPTHDGTTKFNNVAIGYHRMVSPAPGSPTFSDVPLVDPGFQYIEALVASGVTAGCGGGNYCPDSPLTRRQMAVFLAKAFGLHWPN